MCDNSLTPGAIIMIMWAAVYNYMIILITQVHQIRSIGGYLAYCYGNWIFVFAICGGS